MPKYTIRGEGFCTFTTTIDAADPREAWLKALNGGEEVEWEVDTDSEELTGFMPAFEREENGTYYAGDINGNVKQLVHADYVELHGEGSAITLDAIIEHRGRSLVPFPMFAPTTKLPPGVEPLTDAQITELFEAARAARVTPNPEALSAPMLLCVRLGLSVSQFAAITSAMREAFVRERFTQCGQPRPYTHVLRVVDGEPVLVEAVLG